jgi:hypothetical protein
MRICLAIALVLASFTVAAADPARPFVAKDLTGFSAGVLCTPGAATRTSAPQTQVGFTNLVKGTPQIRFLQQKVPAALGVSFGVVFNPDKPLLGVRNLTYRPGAARPDIYYGDISGQPGRYRGFGFEYPEELQTGLWRFEAWQGDRLLYLAEFEVVPAAAMPEMVAQCQGMS